MKGLEGDEHSEWGSWSKASEWKICQTTMVFQWHKNSNNGCKSVISFCEIAYEHIWIHNFIHNVKHYLHKRKTLNIRCILEEEFVMRTSSSSHLISAPLNSSHYITIKYITWAMTWHQNTTQHKTRDGSKYKLILFIQTCLEYFKYLSLTW